MSSCENKNKNKKWQKFPLPPPLSPHPTNEIGRWGAQKYELAKRRFLSFSAHKAESAQKFDLAQKERLSLLC